MTKWYCILVMMDFLIYFSDIVILVMMNSFSFIFSNQKFKKKIRQTYQPKLYYFKIKNFLSENISCVLFNISIFPIIFVTFSPSIAFPLNKYINSFFTMKKYGNCTFMVSTSRSHILWFVCWKFYIFNPFSQHVNDIPKITRVIF